MGRLRLYTSYNHTVINVDNCEELREVVRSGIKELFEAIKSQKLPLGFYVDKDKFNILIKELKRKSSSSKEMKEIYLFLNVVKRETCVLILKPTE